MKMFEFLKLKAMRHSIIVMQVLDRVYIYNVIFPATDLYSPRLTARDL